MNLSNIKLPSNLKFGIFFSIFFGLISVFFLIRNEIVFTVFFASLTIIFLLIVKIKPELLLPLNKLWMRLGLLLGIIVSHIILGSIFFIILTPISFLMRLVGRDELQLKKRSKPSFWIIRISKGSLPNSFKNQF
jgi:hypothetical protein